MPTSSPNRASYRGLTAVGLCLLGTVLATSFVQTCLSSQRLASNFLSSTTWLRLASISRSPVSAGDSIEIPFVPIWTIVSMVVLMTWFVGVVWLVMLRRQTWIDAVGRWGIACGVWWCLLDVWEWGWIVTAILGNSGLASVWSVMPPFWTALCLAGGATTLLTLSSTSDVRDDVSPSRHKWVWLAVGLYTAIYVTMNWRLYFNLLVPHGDSVMYEEHLWNLLHGKGFRSYLDRGLFFGEHIQFVHLFLLPGYALWPSHLFLEACSTAALAVGAFPVFWMVQRHTGSSRTALAAAVAYLLYSPMQFLDIEIDLKTFRPESFGIPLLLYTLDQLDRKNLVGLLVGVLLTLTVKEDYALVFGPLGIWIALNAWSHPGSPGALNLPGVTAPHRRGWIFSGCLLSVFSVAYLWLATRVIMPWFRSGVEVHYASYFARFGKTPEEIVWNILSRPDRFAGELVNPDTVVYAIALLAPLAFIPLLAPGRLAVGLPLFCILCLNELEGSRTPQHQFHAPLVAITFWALAAALPRAVEFFTIVRRKLFRGEVSHVVSGSIVRQLVWTSAFATGIFYSLGPWSLSFWDPGSTWYWGRLYAVQPRAEMFERIATLIPHSARVASTDFVHPRYTHFERSYDYSEYVRQVNAEGQRLPDDTDYLVIDTDHRYSRIKHPRDVPELRDHPEEWELLPDLTDGYFIVLKRKIAP